MWSEAGQPIANDMHIHLRSIEAAKDFETFGFESTSANDVIKEMDLSGVKRGAVISFGFFYSVYPGLDRRAKVQRENDFVASEVAQSNGRLEGYCSFPFGETWMIDELNRCAQKGLKGLKLLLATQNEDLSGLLAASQYRDLMKAAGALKVPVLIHPVEDSVVAWNQVIQNAIGTDADIIIAHAENRNYNLLMDLENYSPPELVKGIHVDVSGLVWTYRNAPKSLRESIAWYLRFAGIDKIFFGSDWPSLPMKGSLDALEMFSKKSLGKVGFTNKELQKIRYDNFDRLFGSKP